MGTNVQHGNKTDGRRRLSKVARLLLSLGVVWVALSLAGAPAWAQARDGGTLRIAIDSVTSLDPHLTNSDYDYAVLSQVFNGLVRTGKDGTPIPDLATSWENPDDVTWIFHLRNDVYWHDGNAVFPEGSSRPVTAEDVKFSIERVKDPATGAPLAGGFQTIASVEVVDDVTVKIVTTEPDPFLLDTIRLAGLAIVPPEAFEKVGADGFARHPVGSGPFEFVSFRPDDRVELRWNEDYPIRPHLDAVTFRILPDPVVTVLALESGDIDVAIAVPPQDVTRLEYDTRVNLYPSVIGYYRGLGFNVERAPFDEWAVRRALALAVDIDPAIANVFGEHAIRAYGQVGPGILGYDPSLADLGEYDPEQAAALLEEAGFVRGEDGTFHRNGEPLAFEVKTMNEPGRLSLLTILVTQWREFGVQAHIRTQETATWTADLVNGNTEVFMDFAFSGPTGLDAMFHSRNAGVTNVHFYRNSEVDRLLDEGSRTLDPVAREQVWKKAQRLIMEDQPILPLYFEFGYSATDSRVHDFVPAQWTLNLVSVENNVWLER